MIRTINFSDPAAVTRHDRMALLVERMLTLHKQLPESLARLTKKTALASGLIKATDGQIDATVQAVRANGRGDRNCTGRNPLEQDG